MQERTNAVIHHGNNEQQQQKSKAKSGHREKEVVVRNLTEPGSADGEKIRVENGMVLNTVTKIIIIKTISVQVLIQVPDKMCKCVYIYIYM